MAVRYNANMIELTEQQIAAVEHATGAPAQIVNPLTNETFVLLRKDEYDRLKQAEYDDSPWTREELQSLAWQAGSEAGWDEMDEYDKISEKP